MLYANKGYAPPGRWSVLLHSACAKHIRNFGLVGIYDMIDLHQHITSRNKRYEMNELRCSVCYHLNPFGAHTCQRCKKRLYVPPETGDTKPLTMVSGVTTTTNPAPSARHVLIAIAVGIGGAAVFFSAMRLPALGLSHHLQIVLLLASVHSILLSLQQRYAKAAKAIVLWAILVYGITSGLYIVSAVMFFAAALTTRRI